MKPSRLIVFLLIACYIGASAQVMNVRKWRKTERDSLDGGMVLFDEKFYVQALPIFESILSHHPDEEFLKFTYAKCALYRSDKHEDAYKYFSEVYEKNKKVPDIQYDMALAAHYAFKFDEASEYIEKYTDGKRANTEAKMNADILKKNIQFAKLYVAKPTDAKITNLGSTVNSPDDEYCPTILADESALIFTYLGSKSIGGKQNQYLIPDNTGNYMEDIYIARREGDGFGTATPLDSFNTNAPDAAISMSNDGKTLFIYQDIGDGHGDIFQSTLNGNNFSKPEKLRGEVNSYSWDGHCSLSPDGQTLYFSSERAGGYGGRDIYKATLMEDQTWGRAVNLGDSINTPLDDDAPFIHADGITLFYSSKGRTSMGGYDIFRSTMKLEDSTFKQTENLGYPINSPSDDIYFVLAANGQNGYYSSGKKDGLGMKDIYKVETNFTGPKPSVYLVKGNVKADGAGVESTIKINITSKGNKLFKTFKSNSSTGSYLATLPAGVNYQLTFSYMDRPDQTLNISTVDLNGYEEKIHDVNFEKPVITPTVILASAEKTVATSPEVVKNTVIASSTPTVAKAKEAVTAMVDPVVTKTPDPAVAVVEKETKTAVETPTVAKNIPEPVKTEPEEPIVAAVEKKETKAPETPAAPPEKKEVAATTPSQTAKTVSSASTRTPGAAWDFTNSPVTSTPLKLPKVKEPVKEIVKEPATSAAKESKAFVPVNGPQIKAQRFAEKYNAVTADEMEFKVQVAAVKVDKNVVLPNQKVLGKVEKLMLGDGFTRITVGGSFKTLGEAFEHNKKIVKAGQKEGFVIALYKGKRVPFEELEEKGLLK